MPDESIEVISADGKEEWLAVVGYEGWYEVSTLGRVRNVKARINTSVGRILNPAQAPNGYFRVKMHKEGISETHSVHRLVARAFLGVPDDGIQVNHLDGVKSNNALGNLEYVTCKENNAHASRMGLKAFGDRNASRLYPEKRKRGAKNHKSKLTEEKVVELRGLSSEGWGCARLGRHFGISKQAARAVALRRHWKHVP